MTEDAELPEREASITNEQPDLVGDGDQDNDADDQGDDAWTSTANWPSGSTGRG